MSDKRHVCSNCKHEFYTMEEEAVILCPVCDAKNVNKNAIRVSAEEKMLETMLNNIRTYGKDLTFEKIDEHYKNPITRCRVRKIYFKCLEILEGKE